MFHKTLQRQLAKYKEIRDDVPPDWQEFLNAVSDTYTHYDEDRVLIERSLEISSQEHMEFTKALKESQKKFETLTKYAPVAIILINLQGNFLFVNERWVTYTGLSLEKSTDNGWMSIVTEEDRTGLQQVWNTNISQRTEFKVEFRYIDPQKNTRWFSCHVIPLSDGTKNVTEYVATMIDITAEMEYETTLKTRTVELEKLNQIMIGRELKMIELKKQIQDLEKQMRMYLDK